MLSDQHLGKAKCRPGCRFLAPRACGSRVTANPLTQWRVLQAVAALHGCRHCRTGTAVGPDADGLAPHVLLREEKLGVSLRESTAAVDSKLVAPARPAPDVCSARRLVLMVVCMVAS